jgi:hypothetical protein
MATYDRQYKVITAALTPGEIAANISEEEAYTVAGVAVGDAVAVNKPTLDAGLGIVGCRVSAADEVSIQWMNATSGALTPTAAETYTFIVVKP